MDPTLKETHPKRGKKTIRDYIRLFFIMTFFTVIVIRKKGFCYKLKKVPLATIKALTSVI